MLSQKRRRCVHSLNPIRRLNPALNNPIRLVHARLLIPFSIHIQTFQNDVHIFNVTFFIRSVHRFSTWRNDFFPVNFNLRYRAVPRTIPVMRAIATASQDSP